ncbi:uncharacterized protein [Heptranchias perlo]|uniref:uncharacterized protein n=1 Tax=Heptranchias perlo TaxID=212740 RepID=UPI00355A4F83
MIKQTVEQADSNNRQKQTLSCGRTILFYQTPRVNRAQLRHHVGNEKPEYVNPQVWAEDPTQVGCVKMIPIHIALQENVVLPSIRQYPLKQQAIPSIDKLIAGLLKQGILIKCQSPCNTPILAVPKPGKPDQYRLVQDLQSINAIVQPLHALVPNPAHILAQVPATAKVFAVVDLQHAFFALPLDPSSQYLFAFTYKGQQYTWTRLPQGFVNSPTLFSRCLQEQLQTLTLKQGSALVQYVDDLLIASPDEQSNRKDTAQLLNHLSSLGYIVSQSKVLVGQQRVKFLGVMLSATERSLERSRIEPICQFPVPRTAQAELFALIRACVLGKDQRVNVYADSRYAFGVVHDFGQLWKNRGFLTSECVHFATHCGAKAVSGTLLATWWHPRLQALAQSISSRCLICQQYNPGKGVPCEWGKTPLPEGPFETLQMDYIELERCQGYKYVLVIVDVFSKWIEAYPTTDNKASTVVKVLMKEIIPRYGIPNQLSSDNGPHFVGQVNKEFCTQMGIKQQLRCAYRPQAAGLVERANQTLKNKLAKLKAETGTTWLKLLPIALFQIRTRIITNIALKGKLQKRSDISLFCSLVVASVTVVRVGEDDSDCEIGAIDIKFVVTVAPADDNVDSGVSAVTNVPVLLIGEDDCVAGEFVVSLALTDDAVDSAVVAGDNVIGVDAAVIDAPFERTVTYVANVTVVLAVEDDCVGDKFDVSVVLINVDVDCGEVAVDEKDYDDQGFKVQARLRPELPSTGLTAWCTELGRPFTISEHNNLSFIVASVTVVRVGEDDSDCEIGAIDIKFVVTVVPADDNVDNGGAGDDSMEDVSAVTDVPVLLIGEDDCVAGEFVVSLALTDDAVDSAVVAGDNVIGVDAAVIDAPFERTVTYVTAVLLGEDARVAELGVVDMEFSACTVLPDEGVACADVVTDDSADVDVASMDAPFEAIQ